MANAAVIKIEELAPPPGEQVESGLSAAGFVAEIVSPAAIGVDGIKMRNQPPRQQEGGDAEVLVVGSRQPGAVAASLSRIQRRIFGAGAIAGQVRGERV